MSLKNLTVEEFEELKEQLEEEMIFREEEHARLLRDYENDTLVREGWEQQDLIAIRRNANNKEEGNKSPPLFSL